MIILDEFIDFIKVIRIKITIFYAEMSLISLPDFVRVVQSWIVALTPRQGNA